MPYLVGQLWKFMAIPHYAYLVLKMPSPIGVLALRANLSITYAYETNKVVDSTTGPRRSH